MGADTLTGNSFIPFRKIPRLYRDIVITEKIDGTNAQIFIDEDLSVYAGSRNRWLSPETDNHGFCKWALDHANELRQLGPGRYYGEWWGQGINRGYGLKEKRFSLFNPDAPNVPACCSTVPVLYRGMFDEFEVNDALCCLERDGSVAAPGFMQPEGIVIYHTVQGNLFKVTLENDDKPKGE